MAYLNPTVDLKKRPTLPPVAAPTPTPTLGAAPGVVAAPAKPSLPPAPGAPPPKPTMPPAAGGLAGAMMTNAPAGPPTPPAPPTAPPAPAAPFTPTTEEQQVAQQPAGTYPDDSPDAGKANTGDAYLDELRSGRYAGAEDWRRFNNAELKAMQKYYIGNGKFKNKYGDVVDKPDDVGPNTPPGYNGTGDFIGGGGAGAGGGGGGFGGAGGFGGIDQPGGLESQSVWQAIQKRLQGDSRYTPEVMAKLLGGVKSQAEGEATAGRQALNASMAARGLGRSTIAAGQEAAIQQKASSDVLQADVQLQKSKIDADFQDKSAAIEEGVNWLNSLRSYISSMYATKSQKEAAMANVQLGYAQVQAAMDRMREQYAQDLTKIGLGM